MKDTAPILKEKGEAITTRMYEVMFSNYPDAKELFKNAPKNQNQILARSIIAYAENIDNLAVLEGAIEKIAKRHIETEVKSEHYPWVIESLLQAMVDVLGDAITDAVKEAWFAAYWVLAFILMKRETELYAA
ncbi:Globin-like protein [Beggiatoa sp. SS]|nr:Globin-like protein [Beggiatoa sp. SS]